MYLTVLVTKTHVFNDGAGTRLLSFMVGMEFLKNGTQVSCGQDGFHSSGGLAHKGLSYM